MGFSEDGSGVDGKKKDSSRKERKKGKAHGRKEESKEPH